MSYFCFGEIELGPSGPVAGVAAWELIRAANDFQLFVACGPNIAQQNVLYMLRSRPDASKAGIAFLLTGSPLEATSDRILSPYQSAHGIEATIAGIRRVEAWLGRVVHVLRPTRIKLLMTEGFDDHYQTITVSDLGVSSTLEGMLREEGDVPSLELIILYATEGESGRAP